jgi:hypothetical protein
MPKAVKRGLYTPQALIDEAQVRCYKSNSIGGPTVFGKALGPNATGADVSQATLTAVQNPISHSH